MRIPEFLPEHPGVYIFIDEEDKPIYIGKAKNLKKRIKQYFRKDAENKAKNIVNKARKLDFIVTNSEVEALLLEDTLIKRYFPKYNISLKDDKKYPYIKVSTEEEYPRVFLTRRVVPDKGIYFGPFTSAKSVRKTLRLLQKLFPLRTCRYKKLPDKECLDYHIGRCPAPCTGKISREEYLKNVKGVVGFLQGKTRDIEKELEEKMWEAAKNQEFERAAKFRDKLFSIRAIQLSQNVILEGRENVDVLGIAGEGFHQVVGVIQVRDGKLFGKETFHLKDPLGEGIRAVLRYFLVRYYRNVSSKPDRVYVPEAMEDIEDVSMALGIDIGVASRGRLRRLQTLAERNARVEFERYRIKVKRSIPVSLLELQKVLDLPVLPVRIEGFDISNIQGKEAVGSCVVFVNGRPDKSQYRRFKIRNINKIDDYSMMAEVIFRRMNRLIKESEKKPDLILVDGGRGQLNTALKVSELLDVEYNVAALAKRFETLYLPDGRAVQLPYDSPALKLLKFVRDEAHRFAIKYHRSLRKKKVTLSVLDTIPGIGERKKKSLIRFFGSERRIEGASIDDLIRVKGIGKGLAKKIYEKFHKVY